MEIVIRYAEADDYEAIHRIFSSPRVIEGTLQLPLPLRKCGASVSPRGLRVSRRW
jgi:hypothetical protein